MEKHLLLSLVLEIYTSLQHLSFQYKVFNIDKDVISNVMKRGSNILCEETLRSMKCNRKTKYHF